MFRLVISDVVREIGFMYGRYKRMTGESNAAMGGKVIGWGNDYDQLTMMMEERDR